MAAITYSTAIKTDHLERASSTTDDKFINVEEQGARVRRAEVSYTNGTGGVVSANIIIARFEVPVTLLKLDLYSDDAIADLDIGHTPISAPVDTDSSIANAAAFVANTLISPVGAVNLALTVPSLVFINMQTGDLADGAFIKGNFYYVIGA